MVAGGDEHDGHVVRRNHFPQEEQQGGRLVRAPAREERQASRDNSNNDHNNKGEGKGKGKGKDEGEAKEKTNDDDDNGGQDKAQRQLSPWKTNANKSAAI